jgi:FAD/FMN-containing dehydrogenase
LVEASANSDPLNSLAQAIENFPGTSEVAVADSPGARQRLWAYRELHTEAIATLGVPHKLDVTLPMAQIADFAADVPAQVCRATGSQGKEVKVILFGHLGDGNIHVNVIGPGPEDQRAEDAVAHMVLERGGSISAEHGVGVAKLKYVTSARSPGDVEFMRRLKAGLDPEGILNPGVLLPPQV